MITADKTADVTAQTRICTCLSGFSRDPWSFKCHKPLRLTLSWKEEYRIVSK